MGKREKSRHFHRNITHAIGHVGKVLSDLSPGTWVGESLTLTSLRLYLGESEKEYQEIDSWFALALAAKPRLGHRPAWWLILSARNYS